MIFPMKVKVVLIVAILFDTAHSFPSMASNHDAQHLKLIKKAAKMNSGIPLNAKRDAPKPTGFEHRAYTTVLNPDSFPYNDKAQDVDLTSDQHKFIPPGPNDIRGPCPGLNLLANHGYLNRNGYTNFAQTIDATNKVFGLQLDFATVLVAYGVIFNGNILDLSFSIGGPSQSSGLGALTNILLGKPGGLNAHNIYEGDASILRRDYYEPGANHDNYRPYLPRLLDLLALGNNDQTPGKDIYNGELMLQHKVKQWHYSVSNNPYFFNPAFAGIVTIVAETFTAEFAANNTLDPITGMNRIYLDEPNLLAFFGAKRNSDGSVTLTPGHEHLLPSWHRRPLLSTYGAQDAIISVIKAGVLDPNLISIGGNAGKVDTFTGINVGDLTDGVLNVQQLLQSPQAMACFIYQFTIQQFIPTQLNFVYKDVGAALNLITQYVALPFKKLANSGSEPCMPFNSNVTDIMSKYPGATIERPGGTGIIGGILGGL